MKQLALCCSQLFASRHKRIESIYSRASSSSVFIGPMVHVDFFWNDNVRRNVYRGPFKNSYKSAATDQNIRAGAQSSDI